MADWTNIPDATFDFDRPVLGSTHLAIVKNFEAMAAGENNAPLLATGWHPYNKTTVGGSELGTFYDFDVNNEAAFIETPAFEDGYEYAVRFQNLSPTASATLTYQAFEEISGGYFAGPATISTSISSNGAISGFLWFPWTRQIKFRQAAEWLGDGESNTGGLVGVNGTDQFGTADRTGKIRFAWSTGNIDGGRAFLLRRREYVTG